ncbi:MAG TPA: HAD-IA family hydrolase [Candidatus Saccharimonadales bacterium]|nr:HAD-IA family hydrolase [Candidatus Saccharimonadales bacterium]
MPEFDKNRALDLIDRSDAVSFDVFDTALLRACLEPSHIFSMVGEWYNASEGYIAFNFKNRRAVAEQDVWRKKEDVTYTLQDIYAELDKAIAIGPRLAARFAQIEEEIERLVTLPNPDVKALYDYALEQGKKIYFLSDMFLSTKLIGELLREAGFNKYEKLFVSSETGASKQTGQLFDVLINESGIPAARILHIGDNALTDIHRARMAGIEAYHIPSMYERAKSDSELRFLYEMPSSSHTLPASVTVAFGLILYNHFYGSHKKLGNKIGYRALGPLLVTFCTWLHEVAEESGVEHLFFLARDGKIMQEAYNQLFPQDSSRTTYMYASRRILSVPAIEKFEAGVDLLAQFAGNSSVGGLLRRIDLNPGRYTKQIKQAGFKNQSYVIKNETDLHKVRQLFMLLKEPILAQVAKERKLLKEYLKSIKFFKYKKIGLVDIGWQGNLQTGLETMFGKRVDITGFYFGLRDRTKVILPNYEQRVNALALFTEFAGDEDIYNEVVYRCIEVLELMFSGERGSIIALSKTAKGFKPVEDDVDLNNKKLISDIHIGAMDFVKEWQFYTKPFGHQVIPKRISVLPIKQIITSPNPATAKRIGSTLHQPGLGKLTDTSYMGLPTLPLWLYILLPWKLMRDYQKSFWKAGFKVNLRADNRLTWSLLVKLRKLALIVNSFLTIKSS